MFVQVFLQLSIAFLPLQKLQTKLKETLHAGNFLCTVLYNKTIEKSLQKKAKLI